MQSTTAPVQVPATQLSDWVQALLSLQAMPSVAGGFEQVPVDASQVPATWHWSLAVQTTGFAPTQAPAWQVSVWVQAFESVQALPSDLGGFEQTPVVVSQVPATWHWSLALQTTGFEPTQAPAWQVSVWVQAFE